MTRGVPRRRETTTHHHEIMKEPSMPTPETAPKGAPCWIDLLSSDTQRSRDFYGALLGWTAEDAGEEYGGYVNFSLGGKRIAGMMGKTTETEQMPDGWPVYFQADDAQKAADSAAANGGSIAMPVMPVPADGHLGHFAFLTDPTGGFFGVWQAGEHAGFEVSYEQNA